MVAVRDGRLTFVGKESALPTAEGPRVFEDLGSAWLMPGMIDLHTHESGESLYSGVNDLNDTVFLTNPGLRASSASMILRIRCLIVTEDTLSPWELLMPLWKKNFSSNTPCGVCTPTAARHHTRVATRTATLCATHMHPIEQT